MTQTTATPSATSPFERFTEEFLPFPRPSGPLPAPSPPDGPDPYGNPDPEWLRIDWREHLRTIEIPMPGEPEPSGVLEPDESRRAATTTVNYLEMGEGSPTVLFLHGLSGAWQNWLENIPHLARVHRVIALDFPGFGASPLPPWEISVEAYGRLVHRFCDALEVEDCVVVGNSMGGFISAEAVVQRPGRFARLVLVSAAGISHARMRREPAEMAARMGIATAPLMLRLEDRALSRARVRWLTFRGVFHDPYSIRAELLYEFLHNGTGRPGVLPAVRGLVGYDFLDRLEDVEEPTLIVWGRNDRIVPSTDSAGYARRLRNSRTVIFDRTGHVPMAERPVRFNRLLSGFLGA